MGMRTGKMPESGMMMGMAVRGTISAVGSSSVTIQTDGGSTTANITASSTIKVFVGTTTPPTTGTIADLVVGKMVIVMGQKNADGSIQAINIVVGDNLPTMKMGGEMGGPMGARPPMGMMPTLNGPQRPGTDGGPQNW